MCESTQKVKDLNASVMEDNLVKLMYDPDCLSLRAGMPGPEQLKGCNDILNKASSLLLVG